MKEEKKKLIEWIDSFDHSHDASELAIPLDLYFTGNYEDCCIITCNTNRAGSSEEFYKVLKEIEAGAEVDSVWIRFYDYDDALKFDDCWINSDGIWIVTTASLEDVMDWLADFEPSESYYEEDLPLFINPPEIHVGFNMIGITWD